MNSKLPVHLIKFEDIIIDPRPTMSKLFSFVLNEPDLENSVIEKYVELGLKEKAPEIYQPREGKVNNNLAKFNDEHLKFMYSYAKDLIDKLGYADSFVKEVV